MSDEVEDIKKSFDAAEKIGVVGSPSSTSGFSIDILGTAANKRLVGNLSVFNYIQDGHDHYALGQITEIEMQNVWTQDATMRGIIRQKGRVDPITERQDVHLAKMMISSVFTRNGDGTFDQSMLGTVPSTGTPIRLLNENIMNSLLASHQQELFYLGKAYGTEIKMPMWFKHFGDPQTHPGGIGEAYHIGIFGKTGSGKSRLALMMMLAYARHRNMSLLVLDPQHQFSIEFESEHIRNLLSHQLSRTAEVISLHNLVLSNYELFKRILILSNFLRRRCSIIHEDNQMRAVDEIVNILERQGEKIVPWHAHQRDSFDRVWSALLNDNQVQRRIYSSPDLVMRMVSTMAAQDVEQAYSEWRKIANLFSYEGKQNARIISDLVGQLGPKKDGSGGRVVVIDLSEINAPADIYWTDEMKLIVIAQFLKSLAEHAEQEFRKDQTLLNTLVILDEAHRLAPREDIESDTLADVKSILIDAVRTTRKYGLGWMFISQTLSSLDREIINQLRIYVFGFGLAWGLERQALREIIGGAEEAIKLYQSFRDPQSSLRQTEYPFMSIGPISPLSFSGTPLFFTSLRYPSEFLKVDFDVDGARQ
jgi:hypothetical protein